MASEIIINSNPREIRVALVENNQLAEIFIEHKAKKGIVGNIYKGIVTKVLPGMQVAFVDIGLEKAGFLYVGDIDVIDLMEFENDEEDSEEIELGRRRDEGFSGGRQTFPHDWPGHSHPGSAQRRPGNRGPDRQKPTGNERGPDHLLHHPGGPPHCLYADRQPGQRVPPYRGRSGERPPEKSGRRNRATR